MEISADVQAYLSSRSQKAAKTLKKKGGKKYFKDLANKRWIKAKE